LVESVAEFEAEGSKGNRVLITDIKMHGVPIQTELQLHSFCLWVGNLESVINVALSSSWELSNKYAKALLQDDAAVEPAAGALFERHNLKGQGSIIGIGDSGINPNSCFFHDSENEVLHTAVSTSTDASTLRLSNHRKIGLYVSSSGDYEDHDGHGTHVSGYSIVQKVFLNKGDTNPVFDPSGSLCGLSTGGLWESFNGMAPESRVAFFDIQKGTTVTVPLSLYDDFFPILSAVGAKVHSNSWGDINNKGQYTQDCADVDQYVWENKDSLLLFSVNHSVFHVLASEIVLI
jgi:hypothetical protein